MAYRRPSEDQLQELTALADKAEDAALIAASVGAPEAITDFQTARAKKSLERMTEASALRMAGFSHDQIATRLRVDPAMVQEILERASALVPKVSLEGMRDLENSRLDRAQAAIWSRVLAGEDKAIDMFLRISARRAALNGMNEAVKVDLTVGVRQEMEAAMAELQKVVLGQVISRHDERRDTDGP